MKKLSILLPILFVANLAFCQLEISAELRPRAEARHGYKAIPKENTDASIFVSQRTRLNFLYTNLKFKACVSIQDIRVWGDEMLYSTTAVFGDNASFDLNEAWFEVIAGKYHSLRIGRQYWVYEDERLLSRRNWNQSSVKYDGLLYKFEPKYINVHLGLSVNNNTDNLTGNDYNLYSKVQYFDTATQTIQTRDSLYSKIKTQNFLFVSKKFSDRLNASVQVLATGYQAPETSGTIYMKGTYGLYLNYLPRNMSFRANGFYQNGKNINGSGVSAFFLNLRGEIRFKPIGLIAGADYHSGHDQTNQDEGYRDTDHFFDVFYGARHRYYGYMDLFENLPKASRNGGLVDLYAGILVNLPEKSTVALDYHYFSLQNKVYSTADPDVVLSRGLGSEVDLTLEIPLMPSVTANFGFSVMLPTDSMVNLQKISNGSNGLAYWGWCMITAKPKLFGNEK